MKFQLSNGGTFEVSGIKTVVENREREGKRTVPTVIWKRFQTKRGTIRWLKYTEGTVNIKTGRVKKSGTPSAGCSDRQMKMMIWIASSRKSFDVWSHGDTINVVLRLERFDAEKEKLEQAMTKLIEAFKGRHELHKSD
jgi:hypothetical protein